MQSAFHEDAEHGRVEGIARLIMAVEFRIRSTKDPSSAKGRPLAKKQIP